MGKIKMDDYLSGLSFKDAKEITEDFLQWRIDWMIENEPFAVNSIKILEDAIGELPFEEPKDE